MPWRKVTLVPFRSRDESELESVYGASSEVVVRSETDLQSSNGHAEVESENFLNFDCDALSNFSDFHELNFDDGLADGSRPVEGDPSFHEPFVHRQDATVSSHSYNRLVSNSFLENARVHDICLPWETPLAKTVFGDDTHLADSLTMPPFLTADQLVVEGETAQVAVESLNQVVTASEYAGGVSFFSAVSNMTDCSFLEKKKLVMESACKRWLSILSWCQSSSTVSKHLTFNDAPQDVSSDMDIVQSIIGVRSPSTALSRANVVRKFLAWVFDKHPHVDLPFCESLVWSYFAHLRMSGAAPTTAASTLSALRYAQHIFGFECLAETTCSRRLIGASEVMFSSKEAVRQALVLSVQNVLSLHAKLEDCNYDCQKKVHTIYVQSCKSTLSRESLCNCSWAQKNQMQARAPAWVIYRIVVCSTACMHWSSIECTEPRSKKKHMYLYINYHILHTHIYLCVYVAHI